jgi:hypothetical protein
MNQDVNKSAIAATWASEKSAGNSGTIAASARSGKGHAGR